MPPSCRISAAACVPGRSQEARRPPARPRRRPALAASASHSLARPCPASPPTPRKEETESRRTQHPQTGKPAPPSSPRAHGSSPYPTPDSSCAPSPPGIAPPASNRTQGLRLHPSLPRPPRSPPRLGLEFRPVPSPPGQAQPCCGDPRPIRSPHLEWSENSAPPPRGWNQIDAPSSSTRPRRGDLSHPLPRRRPSPTPTGPSCWLDWTCQASPGSASRLRAGLPGGRTAGWELGGDAALVPRRARSARAPALGRLRSPPPLAGPGAGLHPRLASSARARLALRRKLTPSLHPVAAQHPRAALSSLAQILATLSGGDRVEKHHAPCLFRAYSRTWQAGTQGPPTTGYNPFAMGDPTPPEKTHL